MNVWPSSLPQQIEVDSYGEAMGDGRLRSQTETGPGKTRRRFTAVTRSLTGVVVMTSDQLTTFETFVRDTLAGGTLPFTMPKGVGRGSGTWTVQIARNMPSWTPSPALDEWRVSLDLWIMP